MKAHNAFLMVTLLLCLIGSNLLAQPGEQLPSGIRNQGFDKEAPGPNSQRNHPGMQQDSKEGLLPEHEGGMLPQIPGLTKEQTEKMTKIHIETTRKILPIDAQIREKEAHLQTLAIADKADLKAMDAVIDEISDLKGTIMKAHNAARQEVRRLLNDDQRTCFDQLPPHHDGPMGQRQGPPPQRMD